MRPLWLVVCAFGGAVCLMGSTPHARVHANECVDVIACVWGSSLPDGGPHHTPLYMRINAGAVAGSPSPPLPALDADGSADAAEMAACADNFCLNSLDGLLGAVQLA